MRILILSILIAFGGSAPLIADWEDTNQFLVVDPNEFERFTLDLEDNSIFMGAKGDEIVTLNNYKTPGNNTCSINSIRFSATAYGDEAFKRESIKKTYDTILFAVATGRKLVVNAYKCRERSKEFVSNTNGTRGVYILVK